MERELVFIRDSSGLVKGLTWWDIFILTISAPAATGILYYSVSTASTYPGANIPLAFLIGMVIFLPIIALGAISSAMISRSGSLYVLISRVINPTVSYLAIFLFFIGYCLSIGVVAYITVGIGGGILVNASLITGINALKNLGEALQTSFWSTIIAVLLVILIWLITLAGVNFLRKTMRILFAISGIAALFTIFYFLFISPENARAIFDNLWGTGSYQEILNLARLKGWAFPQFSWSMTLKLLLVVMWAYGGIELINYASGEVRNLGKSTVRGFMLGWLGLGFLYTMLAFSVNHAYGKFIGAYDYLFQNYIEELSEIMPAINPSVPFYISSIIRNPWIGIITSFGLLLWFITTMLPYFYGQSRVVFALAMDRAIPEKMADVTARRGAPTWASHITMIIALLGVLLNLLGIKIVLSTIEFLVFFIFWLYGLSAMFLPYVKPEIYDRSPIKTNIFGIPFVSILGLLTFAIGWFFVFFTLIHWTFQISLIAVLVMAIGMCLYLRQQSINVKEGINISKIYSEIPPE